MPDDALPEPRPGSLPGGAELFGPVEVGQQLGVKPQVVVNWIREGRAHPSAVDEIGRNRFTSQDVETLRQSLGTRRHREALPPPGSEHSVD